MVVQVSEDTARHNMKKVIDHLRSISAEQADAMRAKLSEVHPVPVPLPERVPHAPHHRRRRRRHHHPPYNPPIPTLTATPTRRNRHVAGAGARRLRVAPARG